MRPIAPSCPSASAADSRGGTKMPTLLCLNNSAFNDAAQYKDVDVRPIGLTETSVDRTESTHPHLSGFVRCFVLVALLLAVTMAGCSSARAPQWPFSGNRL